MQSEERYLTTSLCRVLPAEDFISAKTKLQKAMNSSQLPEHAVLLVKCNKALLGTGDCLLFNQQEI